MQQKSDDFYFIEGENSFLLFNLNALEKKKKKTRNHKCIVEWKVGKMRPEKTEKEEGKEKEKMTHVYFIYL